MALQWSQKLEIGVPAIDTQHKELVNRINLLLEASSKGKGKEEIEGLLNFLASYVVTHFSSEEQQMVRSAYPGYAAHRELHQAFIAELNKLKQQFQTSGATATLTIALQRQVMDWLLQHISKEDQLLANHLKAAV